MIFPELKREAFYRSKRDEYEHAIGLCREALQIEPKNIDLLSLLTMSLEKSNMMDAARDVYIDNYWLVRRNMKLAANAMVFLENNRHQIPAFFRYGDIPECALCYLWYGFGAIDRERNQRLSKIYQQHLKNIQVKGPHHSPYWKESDITLYDYKSYQARQSGRRTRYPREYRHQHFSQKVRHPHCPAAPHNSYRSHDYDSHSHVRYHFPMTHARRRK